jgi:hypothetical protein
MKTTAFNRAKDVGKGPVAIFFEKCGANGQFLIREALHATARQFAPRFGRTLPPRLRVLQSCSCELQALIVIASWRKNLQVVTASVLARSLRNWRERCLSTQLLHATAELNESAFRGRRIG